MNYTANDVLNEIARSFYGTDHEDWLRFDDYEGTLQLGNLKVWVDGDKLVWRDLGYPHVAGTVEIPAGVSEDDELPDGSYVADIVDEVDTWLLGWVDDIDVDWLLEELHDEVGGELTEDADGDRVVVEAGGDTAWTVESWGEDPRVAVVKGSVVDELEDGSVGVVWKDSAPVDPDLAAIGYGWEALTAALKELR